MKIEIDKTTKAMLMISLVGFYIIAFLFAFHFIGVI